MINQTIEEILLWMRKIGENHQADKLCVELVKLERDRDFYKGEAERLTISLKNREFVSNAYQLEYPFSNEYPGLYTHKILKSQKALTEGLIIS